MRLLQITTLISAVLVDAAYAYNAPTLSLGLSNNYQGITNNIKQQQAHISQDSRGEDKSISYSSTYKDYGYLSIGNVPNYLANHQFTPNHNNYNAYGNLASGDNNAGIGTNGNQANNGYRQYTQSWNLKDNLNNDFSSLLIASNAQNNPDQAWKPVNNVQKSTNGYPQSLLLFNKNNNQNIGHGQVDQYPISHSYRNIYIPHADNNANYNSGFSNILTSTEQNGVHNNGLITSQIKYNVPLNNAINQIALTNFNTNYDQSGRLGAPLDNGYTQDIQSSPALNSADSQSTQTFATDVKHNSMYATSTSGSTNNNLAHNNLIPRQNQLPDRLNSLLAVTPIIHKHVYFHVPPPDIDEPQKFATPPLPKKNYKILFIKVPSQTSTLNLARLQQQMAQATALQEKTLIYVLVEKPEEPNPLLLSPTKQSQHQVFFVKYNGDPFNIASQVNDEIDNTGSVNSIVPLAPELVNGQS